MVDEAPVPPRKEHRSIEERAYGFLAFLDELEPRIRRLSDAAHRREPEAVDPPRARRKRVKKD